MTTLAKMFLDAGDTSLNEGSEALRAAFKWSDLFVRKRLTQPLPGSAAAILAEGVAERFVFEVDAPLFVQKLVDAGQLDWNIVPQTITLPDAPIWCEYPMSFADGEPGMMGFMIDRVAAESPLHKDQIAITVVGANLEGDDPHGIPLAMWTVEEFPYNEGTMMMPLFYMDNVGDAMGQNGIDAILGYMKEIMCCFFLLQTPKVVEYRIADFGPRKPKVQKATGKPFVELRKVKIMIGDPTIRYERSGSGEGTGRGPGVKYHRVIPHFRTYGKAEGRPRARYVPAFWRGDPTKGIIIHERHVKLGATNEANSSPDARASVKQ